MISGQGTQHLGSNLGQQMIQELHRHLMIDEQWTEWHEDGFTWWSAYLAQRFRSQGPRDIDGTPTWWLSYEMALLKGVEDGMPAHLTVMYLNRMSNLTAFYLTGGRLVARGRVYALPESAPDRIRLLADRAIIANVDASSRAMGLVTVMQQMSEAAGGHSASTLPDFSAHPVSGPRPQMDDMLNVVDRLFRPWGSDPLPRGDRPDLDAAANALLVMGFSVDGGNATGDVVAALGGDSADLLIIMDLNTRHPLLGHGLLTRLQLDSKLSEAAGSAPLTPEALARILNDEEWTASQPLLHCGAWTPTLHGEAGRGTITYASFLPNLGLAPGTGTVVAIDAARRGVWARQQLEQLALPGMTDAAQEHGRERDGGLRT